MAERATSGSRRAPAGSGLETVTGEADLRRQVRAWRTAGLTVGFVPTMGALHDGHLALVRRALELADRAVVSVFVNPAQFGPQEDFARYPRDTERDTELLAAAGCDLLFLPAVETIYPPGHCTFVDVAGPSEGLEGDCRPGHFRGVATVVCQLFNIVQPDLAVFGEKDAQQLAVVRRMVVDLHLPVEIVAHPTVRESDGLALSSRNRDLSASDRQAGLALSRALAAVRELIANGERSAAALEATMLRTLAGEPRLAVDYAAVVDAETFQPVERLAGRVALAVAGTVGRTRLLDNLRGELSD